MESVCFSPDGKLLASGSKDNAIKLIGLVKEEHSDLESSRFYFSSDEKLLA